MNYEILSKTILRELEDFEIISPLDYFNIEMNEDYSYFDIIYNKAYESAPKLSVPENTRLKIVKKMINRIMNVFTKPQVDYNKNLIELIKIQHIIILKNQNLLKKLYLKLDTEK